MAKKYDEAEGVWRTIGGRRVFIRKSQSLVDAMVESGKFKDLKKRKEEFDKKQDKKDSDKEYEEYKKMRLDDPSDYNEDQIKRFNELDKKYLDRFSEEPTKVVRYRDEYAVIQNGGIQSTFETLEEAKEFERTRKKVEESKLYTKKEDGSYEANMDALKKDYEERHKKYDEKIKQLAKDRQNMPNSDWEASIMAYEQQGAEGTYKSMQDIMDDVNNYDELKKQAEKRIWAEKTLYEQYAYSDKQGKEILKNNFNKELRKQNELEEKYGKISEEDFKKMQSDIYDKARAYKEGTKDGKNGFEKEIEYVAQDGKVHKMMSYDYPEERDEYHKFLQDKYGTYKEEEIKDDRGRTDYKKLRREFYDERTNPTYGNDIDKVMSRYTASEDKAYDLYKRAKENPDSIDPMTENSTDWEALEEKFGKRYNDEIVDSARSVKLPGKKSNTNLNKYTTSQLKSVAEVYDIDTKGLSRQELLQKLLAIFKNR